MLWNAFESIGSLVGKVVAALLLLHFLRIFRLLDVFAVLLKRDGNPRSAPLHSRLTKLIQQYYSITTVIIHALTLIIHLASHSCWRNNIAG